MGIHTTMSSAVPFMPFKRLINFNTVILLRRVTLRFKLRSQKVVPAKPEPNYIANEGGSSMKQIIHIT